MSDTQLTVSQLHKVTKKKKKHPAGTLNVKRLKNQIIYNSFGQ